MCIRDSCVRRAARLAVDRAHAEVGAAAGAHGIAYRALEGAQHRLDTAVVRGLRERREVAPVAPRAAEGAVDQVAAHVVRRTAVTVEALSEASPVRTFRGR